MFNKAKKPGHQYIAEASSLQCIKDSAYDFVLSSHCIEHLANPLKGLAEWTRVLRKNGLLVLVAPHKEATFDHRRPTTTLQHLIEDFNNQTDENDTTHLEEILRLHDLTRDPKAGDYQTFQARAKRNIENRSLHQHVFDTRLVVEMANHMELQILAVELFRPNNIALIARKIGSDQPANNRKFRGSNAPSCWINPFP